jgi:hypothetical protein
VPDRFTNAFGSHGTGLEIAMDLPGLKKGFELRRVDPSTWEAILNEHEVQRMAKNLVLVEPKHLYALRACLSFLLNEISVILYEARDRLDGKRTKKQLLKELETLLTVIDDQEPRLSERVIVELGAIEQERCFVLAFGRKPFNFETPEHYDQYSQLVRQSAARIQKCRSNPSELRTLLRDAIAFVEERLEYKREWYARKKHALDYLEYTVIHYALNFYLGTLKRPRKITKELISFTISLFSMICIDETDWYTVKQALIRAKRRDWRVRK